LSSKAIYSLDPLKCVLTREIKATANYIVSQLAVWEIDFPGGTGNDNVKWRAFIWGVSEVMLFLSIAINYLPPKWYKAVFRFSLFIIMLDFFLCLIWLPIAVHNTYGFRSAKDVFTLTCTFSRNNVCADWCSLADER
jgi:translation initiation factor 5B